MLVVAGPPGNLAEAIRTFDRVKVYDNTRRDAALRLVLEARGGRVRQVLGSPPDWLRGAFRGTEYEFEAADSCS
jgi:hypothetical protein